MPFHDDGQLISTSSATVADPRTFYDELAGQYHLLFLDWWDSARRQGEVIGSLLRRQGVAPPAAVLDCTCGIGTQALPLAAAGYRVIGSDLSEPAIARAGAEARERGIDVRLLVADVRTLAGVPDKRFDAVISCDNSLPHLLSDADLAAALRAIRSRLPVGGLFVGSTRDYDAIVRDRMAGVMPGIDEVDGERRIIGQAWRWAEDHRTVEIHLFMLRQQETGWVATVHSGTYRALQRHELTAALTAAGFTDVEWLSPDESGYYQPVVLARAGVREGAEGALRHAWG